uniref:Uncharacterized protein n=1 Tax=Solanum tuberosum TaxID=4113 RepID=M1DED5_SOLTU
MGTGMIVVVSMSPGNRDQASGSSSGSKLEDMMGENGLKNVGIGCKLLFTGSLTNRGALHGQLYGTMPHRRKNATKPAPHSSQSQGHSDREASSSEVRINVTPEDHSP